MSSAVVPVLGEGRAGDLGERAQGAGEHPQIEPWVSGCGEIEQASAAVPAAGQDQVDVQEIAGQGPAVQRCHLVRDCVVGVQDRADFQRDGSCDRQPAANSTLSGSPARAGGVSHHSLRSPRLRQEPLRNAERRRMSPSRL
jgi:hypothetical protein